MRSHTTYTKRASLGSALMVSLSLKAAEPSRMSVTGSDHVMPPSPERETSTALSEPAAKVPPLVATVTW